MFQVTPPATGPSRSPIHGLERVEPVGLSAEGPATAVVADSDPALAEASRKLLEEFGIRTLSIDRGSEALLQIVRRPPTLVVLGGHLAGIAAPAVAELIRRNPALASVRIIRIAPIDEPAGVPEFEADVTLEPADAASGLPGALRRLGIGSPPAAPALSTATPPAAVDALPSLDPSPPASESPEPSRAAAAPTAAPAADLPPNPPSALSSGARAAGSPDEMSVAGGPSRPASAPTELAAAERLARIAVSDIVLYNEARFRKAVEEGSIPDSFGAELDEARQMFAKRIPESIRRQRDFLTDELVRRAEKLAQAS